MAEVVTTPATFQPGDRLHSGQALNTTIARGTKVNGTGIVASGTTIADAHQLYLGVNFLGTVAGSSGAKLPAMVPGDSCIVFNQGAAACQIYSGDSTIDGTAGATGVALTNTKRAVFFQQASGVIVSAQLGVVSA